MPDDDLERALKEQLQKSICPMRIRHVEREAWERLIVRGEVTRNKADQEKNRIHFYDVINPVGLDGCCIMGANLEASLTFAWLEQHGVLLCEHGELAEGLRFRKHQSRPTDIHYAVDRPRFNRTLRKDTKFTSRYEHAALALVGNEPFLVHSNKDHTGALTKHPHCVKLPATPQGLNKPEFIASTSVVCIGAFNKWPHEARFLAYMGLSQEILDFGYYELIYQAVMRCNLRVPDSGLPITVVVPDKGVAEYLARLLPGSKIKRIQGFEQFDRKKALSSAERARRYRSNKKGHNSKHVDVCTDERHVFLKSPYKESVTNGTVDDAHYASCLVGVDGYCQSYLDAYADNPILTLQVNTGFVVTFLGYVDSPYVKRFELDLFGVACMLATCSGEEANHKSEIRLYNLVEFDRTGGRQLVNFVCSRGAVLDFDGGDLSPEMASQILRKHRIRHLAYNSFSRSEVAPNRFHVVVPFSKPSTIEEMAAVDRYFSALFESEGLSRKSTKQDIFNAVRFYRSPSTNRSEPDMGFFAAFGFLTEIDELVFSPDPTACLASYPAPEHQRPPEYQPRHDAPGSSADKERVRELVRAKYGDRLRSGRNGPVFWSGNRYAEIGLTPKEIEEELLGTFGDDRNARRHIASTIKTLEKAGRLEWAYRGDYLTTIT